MKYTVAFVVCAIIIVSLAGCEWFSPPVESSSNQTIVIEIPEDAIEPIPGSATTTTLQEKGGIKTVFMEGDLVSFANLKATDPDGDPVQFIFSSPLNSKGEWQTKEGDAGEYNLNITASDGKAYSAPFLVKITVIARNKAPVFAAIKDVTVKEGDTIDLEPLVKVTDANGDKITLTYSGWITSPKYKTSNTDAGIHVVTITASDGKEKSEVKVNIIVQNVDQAPVLEEFKYDIVINEGELVKVAPKVTDPDNDVVTLSCAKPLNDKCEWQTKVGDEGTYKIKVTASDGTLKDEKEVIIIVNSVNKKPVFNSISEDISAFETQLISILANVTDPEGQKVTLTYSKPFANDGTWKPPYGTAGTYNVNVTATDGVNAVAKTVEVIVKHMNRAPVIKAIQDITVTEGQTVVVTPIATDPDGDKVTIEFSKPLDEFGEWETKKGDAGEYDAVVTANDGKENVLTTFLITVNKKNNAPVLAKIADITSKEGDKIVIPATATDADGDKITFTFSPPFDKNGMWQTGYEDARTYDVVVTATDGIDAVSQKIKVSVANYNRPPCIIGINC